MSTGYLYDEAPVVSPQGTTIARYIAASIDNVIAMVLAVVAAKQIDGSRPILQVSIALLAYLGYFFLFEIAISRTPGKLVTGLKIIDYEGDRCTVRQTAIRTLFRLLEANPILLGGIPAAARILWSKDKQRFGDKWAETIVVFR